MKLLKNPIFWALVLFAGGMALGAWGWDKNESTIPERARFAVPIIVTGILMIIGGAVIMFSSKGSK